MLDKTAKCDNDFTMAYSRPHIP